MALNLVVSDTFRFNVSGTIAGEKGEEPFSFDLIAKRMSAKEIRKTLSDKERPVSAVMPEVVIGWEGVTGDDNKPVPFSAEAFESLLNIPGMDVMIFQQYFAEVGAKAKNS